MTALLLVVRAHASRGSPEGASARAPVADAVYAPPVSRTRAFLALILLAACEVTSTPIEPPVPDEPDVCACADDGIACTTELCGADGQCLHRPDDRACSASGQCEVATCDVGAGGCVASPRPTGTPCELPESEQTAPGGPTAGCFQAECRPGNVVGLQRVGVLRIVGAQPMSDDGFTMDIARVDDRTGDGVDEVAVTSFRLIAFSPDALPGRILLFDPTNGAVVWDAPGSADNVDFGYRMQRIDDVTGDGLSDLAATERVNGVPGVDAIDGTTGAIVWRFEEPEGLYARFAPAGDQNGDGVTDLVAVIGQGLAVLSGVDGSILDAVAGSYGPTVTSVTDLDGDGRRDFVSDSEPAVYRYVRVISSATLEDLQVFDHESEHVWLSGRCDVDGDGHDEGLLTHSDGVLREREAYDLLTGESKWVQRYPRSAPVPIFDVDGDGITDLLTDGSLDGSGWRTIIAQSGADGSKAFEFVPVDDHDAIAPIDTGFAQIGDVDGDGVDDVAVGDELVGTRVWLYRSVVRWF